MPIKGLSERKRVPRLGKIHLGIKETSARTGNPYPKPVDYFVVKADETTSVAAAEAFKKVYGEQPRELDIMFHSNEAEEIFPQWFMLYGAGSGLVRMCDGENAKVWGESGMQECDCLCDPDERECREVASLRFMLPKVAGIGIWQIDTGSVHSILNINGGVSFVQMIAGRLAGLLLKLRVVPKEVAPGGKKKTVWVLELKREDSTIYELMEQARTPMQALPAPEPMDHQEVPSDLFPQAATSETRQDDRGAEVSPSMEEKPPKGVTTPSVVNVAQTAPAQQPMMTEAQAQTRIRTAKTEEERARAWSDIEAAGFSTAQYHRLQHIATAKAKSLRQPALTAPRE